MSMSFKASPDGTYGEILVNGQVVAKLPVTGDAVIPNLVGTVSQSGGVPTGAVVERGSNANGEYVRFADGTQICTAFGTLTSDGVRFYRTWTFPATFASGNYFALASFDIGSANWTDASDRTKIGLQFAYSRSVSSCIVGAEEINGQAILSGNTVSNVQHTAIGRWF